jgi:potassium-transporting ATPase KdpC subunit
MKTQSFIAFRFLLVMTILTGIVYPLLMTGLAQISYPEKANGSLIMKEGTIIGSELIGQKFDDSIYFWSRPSAIGYNPLPSGASNLGPTSNTLKKQVSKRRELFAKTNLLTGAPNIPKEMIFASGSGLDPHISPEAATMQVNRISIARHFDNNQKQSLLHIVKELTEKPQFLILGKERINVLMLNLQLDRIVESNSNKN